MLRVASNRETLDSPPSRPPTEGSHDCTFRKLAPHSWGLTAGPPLAHAPQRLTAAHALAGHPPQPPRPALSRAPSSSSFPQSLGYPLARSPARRPDVSAQRPRAWTCRSPDFSFASACCEESPDSGYGSRGPTPAVRASCLRRPTAALVTGLLAFHSKEAEAMIGFYGRHLEAIGGERKEGVPRIHWSI